MIIENVNPQIVKNDNLFFKWKIMNYKWNSSVHFKPGTKNLFGMGRPVIDLRNNHNFVHIQLNGKNGFSKDKINRIVNLPVEDWVLNSLNTGQVLSIPLILIGCWLVFRKK